MYKICVFIPENSVEKVKQAMFDAGAGRIGNYDSCCWQTEGTGQFRPLWGSNPALGVQGEIEKVSEVKVEMVCGDDLVKGVVLALRGSHPYEEPAFDVFLLVEF